MSIIIPGINAAEKISRISLLTWLNGILSTNYQKVEELHSGVAYCQLMNILYPGCICAKNIKINAKLEHEYIHNFILMQKVFFTFKINKNIPIDKLVKGRFQDNFEFGEWFKRFFDLNCNIDLTAIQSQKRKSNGLAPAAVTTKSTRVQSAAVVTKRPITVSKSVNSYLRQPITKQRSISPAQIDILQNQVNQLKTTINTHQDERNYYCSKLIQIKNLFDNIEKNGEGNLSWINKLKAIIVSSNINNNYRHQNDGENSASAIDEVTSTKLN